MKAQNVYQVEKFTQISTNCNVIKVIANEDKSTKNVSAMIYLLIYLFTYSFIHLILYLFMHFAIAIPFSSSFLNQQGF